MSNKLKVYGLMRSGFEKLQEERAERDKQSIGTLRGGSIVALTKDGKWIGDPRTALIRYIGLQGKTSYDQSLLFQAGLANEDMIHEYFDAANVEYKCEEEIPVTVTTPKGRKITGRPDCIIYKDGIPQVLLEYKGIFGGSSALKNHHAGKRAFRDVNVLQCAFYSKFHGLDGLLIYTNRSHHTQNKISKYKQEELFDPAHRSFVKNKRGEITRIQPYQSFYDITWNEYDMICVDGVQTSIGYEDIMRGYDAIADMAENQTPPPLIPSTINVWGEKQWVNQDFYDYKDVDHETWETFIEGVEYVNSSQKL